VPPESELEADDSPAQLDDADESEDAPRAETNVAALDEDASILIALEDVSM
jgi:hypothetical protein